MMHSETGKMLALDQELYNAIRLIRSGLGQLQNLDGANDFYHLPILSLANGFERLMKVILCFRVLEQTGKYPDSSLAVTGRKGHDLEALLNRIKSECFLEDYRSNAPIASVDLDFIASHELTSLVKILSNFGQSARYYHLDVVLGRKTEFEDPERMWDELGTSILLSRPDLMQNIQISTRSNEVIHEITSIIVSKLERFARALARLFTVGDIGQEAKRYKGHVSCFLMLSDQQLGKTIYDPCGRS